MRHQKKPHLPSKTSSLSESQRMRDSLGYNIGWLNIGFGLWIPGRSERCLDHPHRTRMTSDLPVVLVRYWRLFFLFMLLAWQISASAETLDFNCSVNGLMIALHVDTEVQTVQQIARFEGSTEVGKYTDGVYGPVSHTGAGASIPRVHQFVLISETAIQFGAELKGMRDVAILDRRLGILTLPRGQSGWCFQK
jgi:hypothetical protein